MTHITARRVPHVSPAAPAVPSQRVSPREASRCVERPSQRRCTCLLAVEVAWNLRRASRGTWASRRDLGFRPSSRPCTPWSWIRRATDVKLQVALVSSRSIDVVSPLCRGATCMSSISYMMCTSRYLHIWNLQPMLPVRGIWCRW
jgi:hypothetical protein